MSEKKILIVDDDECICEILESKLRIAGYNVVVANNGEQGIMILKKELPDLVMTDLMMPKMDGLDFILQIRKVMQTIPILCISGQYAKKDIALNLGADDFLEKPAQTKEMLSKIENLLEAPPAKKSWD